MRAAIASLALLGLAGVVWADAFAPDPGPMLNRRVQAANVTTDGAGGWSVIFAEPFNSASPVLNVIPVNAAANPGVCNVATRSAAGATGKCWQSGGVTVSILGSVVNVFSSAGNLPVMVIAREPTQ